MFIYLLLSNDDLITKRNILFVKIILSKFFIWVEARIPFEHHSNYIYIINIVNGF